MGRSQHPAAAHAVHPGTRRPCAARSGSACRHRGRPARPAAAASSAADRGCNPGDGQRRGRDRAHRPGISVVEWHQFLLVGRGGRLSGVPRTETRLCVPASDSARGAVRGHWTVGAGVVYGHPWIRVQPRAVRRVSAAVHGHAEPLAALAKSPAGRARRECVVPAHPARVAAVRRPVRLGLQRVSGVRHAAAVSVLALGGRPGDRRVRRAERLYGRPDALGSALTVVGPRHGRETRATGGDPRGHQSASRTQRRPRLPVELSGVFALRAATRYRKQ